jgi:hypothetical protein
MSKASFEKYPGQGKREKRDLFKCYQIAPICTLYKRRFFDLFSNCCYKCGLFANPDVLFEQRHTLCMDHHIPMALGGHLVPGNIVSLCRRCNEAKLVKHPNLFYSASELINLQPLLDQQQQLFEFTFDWNKWSSSREQYLLSLGIDAATVHNVLHNQDHPDFIGDGSDRLGIIISVDGVRRL